MPNMTHTGVKGSHKDEQAQNVLIFASIEQSQTKYNNFESFEVWIELSELKTRLKDIHEWLYTKLNSIL